MKYEYEPFLLKNWIRDNRKSFVKPSDKNFNKKYKSTLDALKMDFKKIQTKDEDAFFSWIGKRSRREMLLLPNLYEHSSSESIKKNLIRVIQDNAKQEKRLFRVMVDVVYQTGNLNEMWNLVKYSYSAHKDKIERRFHEENKGKWSEFMVTDDPVHFLAKKAFESEKSFLDELETFYLSENYPLFKLVLLDVLGFADEDFFIKEKRLYKTYFKQSTNEEQQKMAESLVRNCNLNSVRDLSKLVYEKLKTYRRKPMLWKKVSEAEKKRFHKWILQLELKDFFSQVNQSHERFVYWKKYIHKLDDVVVTDNKTTLVMYFSDVVVMEVLGTGAVYIYTLKTFQKHFQPRIDQMLQDIEESERKPHWARNIREVKRSSLMDKYLIHKNGWLSHRSDWQLTFDYWLSRNLGWEVNADVLQEEAERMEAEYHSN